MPSSIRPPRSGFLELAVRLDQLLIKRGEETVGSIPCEDVGVLVVDHPGTTYTHKALAALADCDAVLVVCGQNHLPVAVLLPLASHSQVIWRIQDQLAVSKPLRKQLWKQLVQAKIRAQAGNLSLCSPARAKLLEICRQVRSGDPANMEAQAARVYWAHWLPTGEFRRDPEGDEINGLLNYGYAVLRAAVARAIVSGGLLPSLGLFHSNRSNAFCLADDLIEPLRPLVDCRVRELCQQGLVRVAPETKASLLTLLADPVRVAGEVGPLMVSLHRMVASLVRCYEGKERQLQIPISEGNSTPIDDAQNPAAAEEESAGDDGQTQR